MKSNRNLARLGLTLFLSLGLAIPGFTQDHKEIHQFVDDWHLAAAQVNAESFFGSIADDGIYIGTADFERWSKEEFIKFAKPYFDKGKAWDFKPYDRDLHVSPDGQYAWFSELLTTWMGTCRGSGILVRNAGGWKISQYHLSVTVPNEIIDDFIKLVDAFNKKETK
jgi:ketosteroid isomerase-like protein